MTTMIKPIKRSVALVCFLVIVSGLELEAKSSITGDQSADVIFIGDHIITVDSGSVDVTAVAVAGQEIIATGSAEEILKLKNNNFINVHVRAHVRVLLYRNGKKFLFLESFLLYF